jgi:chromosome segregation ATPase
MKPYQKPSEPPTDGESSEPELEEQLLEVEQALAAFKERYNQVQADRSHQQELQQHLDELHHSKQPGMKTELRQIQQQLEELELRLESKLFSWKNLKEPFWMAVRFGGLGVIIGWLLK